jgi:hypothetical protein
MDAPNLKFLYKVDMNTDRSSSSRTRQVKAQTIAAYNNSAIANLNAGNPPAKRTAASNTSASVINDISLGEKDCCALNR